MLCIKNWTRDNKKCCVNRQYKLCFKKKGIEEIDTKEKTNNNEYCLVLGRTDYFKNSNKYIYASLPYSKIISNKLNLWLTMLKYYKRNIALTFLPKTYIPTVDKELLFREFDRRKTYFLKNNKQRQEGICLTNKLMDILHLEKKGYLLAQECLDNSYTYKKYKVHFRVYFVIIHQKGNIKCYLFNDGLVGYSKEVITSAKSLEEKIISGSGIASKDLYKKGFPVLISEFPFDYNKFITLTSNVLSKLIPPLQEKAKIFRGINGYEILGVDIFLHSHFGGVKILECNIGPGMKHFTDRDFKMRVRLYKHTLNLIKNKSSNVMIELKY